MLQLFFLSEDLVKKWEFYTDVWLTESLEDAMLFMRELGEDGKPRAIQKQVWEDFYQEEFEDISVGMLKNNKRNCTPRDKIRAAIAAIPENPTNPHDYRHLVKTEYDSYSGYVHGAYPRIMELYMGRPPYYHTSGTLNTPRITECIKRLIESTYKGVLFGGYAAQRLGEKDIQNKFIAIKQEMEKLWPALATDSQESLSKLKRKK